MKLGPLQQKWVERLKNRPEKQAEGYLGYRHSDGSYEACCLGELLLCYYRRQHKKLPVGQLFDDEDETELRSIHEKVGLKTSVGVLKEKITVKDKEYSNLVQMNDEGLTWPEIAEIVEENPELVFTKSV